MQTAEVTRTKVFPLRLSDEEHARLMRLAEGRGVSAADIMRLLLREEEQRQGGPPALPKKPAKKAPAKQ